MNLLIAISICSFVLLIVGVQAYPFDDTDGEDDDLFDSFEHPVQSLHRDYMPNPPFSVTEKAAIKACYVQRHCKKPKGQPRVCTHDGKGFKNACKWQCAKDVVPADTWANDSRVQVPCPAGYHG